MNTKTRSYIYKEHNWLVNGFNTFNNIFLLKMMAKIVLRYGKIFGGIRYKDMKKILTSSKKDGKK